MTLRSVSIVLLCVAALAATGLLVALSAGATSRLGVASPPWLWPGTAFLTFVGVFFLGREAVLPPALASRAGRAFAVLCAWMAVTILGWQGLLWGLRPLLDAAGIRRGQLVALIVCLVASVKLLDRLSAPATRRRLP